MYTENVFKVLSYEYFDRKLEVMLSVLSSHLLCSSQMQDGHHCRTLDPMVKWLKIKVDINQRSIDGPFQSLFFLC